MAKNRLSRDQRRKQKVTKRHQSQISTGAVLPYQGEKYRADAYLPLVNAIELGTYMAFVASERKITDWHVKETYEYLVRELRGEKPAPLSHHPQVESESGGQHALIVDFIKREVHNRFSRQLPTIADRIGVLRTLLGSVQTWSRPSRDSRGYLSFLDGFMKKLGHQVELCGNPGEHLGEDEEEVDEDTITAQELSDLGCAWLETGEEEAKEAFFAKGKEMIDAHNHGLVLEVCQSIIGSYPEEWVPHAMNPLLQQAWKKERPDSGKSWLTKALNTWTNGG